MAFIIEIDDSLETPLYAQIKLSVISGIKTGKLKPGDTYLYDEQGNRVKVTSFYKMD